MNIKRHIDNNMSHLGKLISVWPEMSYQKSDQ